MARRVEHPVRRRNRWGHRTSVSESAVSPGSRRGSSTVLLSTNTRRADEHRDIGAALLRSPLRRGASLTRSRDILSTRRRHLRVGAARSDTPRRFLVSSIESGADPERNTALDARLRAARDADHGCNTQEDAGAEPGPRRHTAGEPSRAWGGPAEPWACAWVHGNLASTDPYASATTCLTATSPGGTQVCRQVHPGRAAARNACAGLGTRVADVDAHGFGYARLSTADML